MEPGSRSRSRSIRSWSRASGRRGRRQEGEVRPVEAGDDGVGLLDPEALADVGDHRGRGRRGEGEHALGPELACPDGELEVVGPEVVAPLRDAVRLVDGEEGDLRGLELGEEALVVEALRGDVEQSQTAVAQPVRDVPGLVGTEARVEARGIHSPAGEEVDLVLHQRDQRRDDDRHAVEHERRELVAEALAAAGREDGQRRAAGEQRLDDLLLAGAEGVEAEPLREDIGGARGRVGDSHPGGNRSGRTGAAQRTRVRRHEVGTGSRIHAFHCP